MGIFKDRSDFFKTRAIKNKKIAHTAVVDGEERNAFHRLNDEEELQAACVNYAHFPCMVHFGLDARYTGDRNAVPKRKIVNELLILQKVDHPTGLDQVEDAYDLTYEIVEELLSWIYNETINHGYCAPFHNFDLARVSVIRQIVNNNLFGWLLSFEDDVYADSVTQFDATKWND
jgi:hypothetical protein